MPHERLLDRVHFFRSADAFDGRNDAAFSFNGEHRAGVGGVAVDQYGAGATRTAVADLFGAGQIQAVSKRVQERDTRFETELTSLAIDLQGNGNFARSKGAAFL